MSDVDPTPGSPLTIGDRLGWFRGDVNNNHLQMLAALTVLAGGLNPATLRGIVEAIQGVQGTPDPATLREIDDSIAALRGPQGATLSTLVREATFTAAMTALGLQVGDIAQLAALIRTAIGVPTGDATTTVLGRLAAIERLLMTQTAGLLPVIGDGDIFGGPPIVVEGRKYATWPNPPEGTTTSPPFINLLTVTSWDGWSFYVQTTDPAPQMSGTVVAPNFWQAMGGDGARSWSVEMQYPIVVTLRRPQLTTYMWEPGEQDGYTTQFGFRIYPRYSKYPELQWGWTDGVVNSNLEVRGAFGGWRVTNTGQSPYIYARGAGAYTQVLPGNNAILPAGTQGIVIFEDSGGKGVVTLSGS